MAKKMSVMQNSHFPLWECQVSDEDTEKIN